MRWTICLTAAVLLTGRTALTQERFFIQPNKNGKQVITTIEKVSPPAALPGMKVPAVVLALNQAAAPGEGEKGKPPVVPPGTKAPPPVVEFKLPPGPSATPVVLEAHNWRCCRCFTDECQRRWLLVCGPTLCTCPPLLSGWLMQTTDHRWFFFTTSGCLFVNVVPPLIVVPGPVIGVPGP